MFEELNGKVCVITGGAGGIGRETGRSLGKIGMKIFVADIGKEIISDTLASFRSEGIICDGCVFDISDGESVKAMSERCVSSLGDPYSLVNCAGIYKDVYFKDMTFEQWRQTLDINLNGVFHTIKSISDIMMKNKCGTIVNLTSQAGISGSAMHSHYSASKAGIIGLTVTLAREFAQYGIRINCIAPGIINTNMSVDCMGSRADMFLAQILLKRWGTPEEVAKVVLFLLSDMSSYMTGQTLNVTGGWLLHS